MKHRAREPDPRHDHLPELLPHVRQAGRDDRYRRDTEESEFGRRSTSSTSSVIPDQSTASTGSRLPGRGLPQRRARSGGTRWSTRSSDCQRPRPAGPRRHHLDREVSEPALPKRLRSAERIPHVVLNAKHSTSAKRPLSRRPGGRVRSPSPPTWRVAVPTSSSAATRRGPGARVAEVGTRTIEPERYADNAVTWRKTYRAGQAFDRARARRGRRGLGGLHILGTERHESRRIDNQLRGTLWPSGRSRLVALLPCPSKTT